jgi:cephalosporin hydroxylase
MACAGSQAMTFDEMMVFTRTVSSNAAFEDPECLAYFNLLQSLPEDALVVEVGLQYGRSSAVALQVCRERKLRYHGIDPFIGHPEVEEQWLKMARSTGYRFQLSRLSANEVIIGEPIDLVLIDGDHTYQGVLDDCNHFLPQVRQGGYAVLHDYMRESLPDVFHAARAYLDANRHWLAERGIGTPVMGSLGIWRRA